MLATFDYTVPESVSQATAALAATAGSRPLAGGQLLLGAMRVGRQAPPLLVDLRRIGALRAIHAENGGLRIGSLFTLDELLAYPALNGHQAAFVAAVRATGDPQLRNRGTVGGSLAARQVVSHLAAPLLVAEASIMIAGADRERTVSAEEFYAGEQGLADGELITSVRLPALPADMDSAYEVVADRASTEPICGVAVAVARDQRGNVAAVRVAVTGATRRPTRLGQAERALAGAGASVAPTELPVGPAEAYVDDDRASAGYRAHLTRVLTGRAIARCSR
jgi:carbon-monoxide dehydrogenase medium subunit